MLDIIMKSTVELIVCDDVEMLPIMFGWGGNTCFLNCTDYKVCAAGNVCKFFGRWLLVDTIVMYWYIVLHLFQCWWFSFLSLFLYYLITVLVGWCWFWLAFSIVYVYVCVKHIFTCIHYIITCMDVHTF